MADLTGLAARLGRHGPVTGIAIERAEGLPGETLQELQLAATTLLAAAV